MQFDLVQLFNGCEIPSKSYLVYSGSTLSASGDIISEVNRRQGMASADFTAFERVWKHSSLISRSKLRVFNACVVSKLLYCLHTAWLNKAELRRLDAFQTSCLRKILRIPHSFISRVSNAEVLSRPNHHMLSKILQYRQIMWLKRVADLPSEDVMRTCVLQTDSFNLLGVQGSRRRGRPRKRWAVEVYRFVKSMADYDRCSLDSLWQLPPLNGSGGLRISALVPDGWHLFMPMCHCRRGLLTHPLTPVHNARCIEVGGRHPRSCKPRSRSG